MIVCQKRHILVMAFFWVWSIVDCSAEPNQRALLKAGSEDVLWIGPEESAVQATQRHQHAKKWPVPHLKQMTSDHNPEHLRSPVGQETELRWEQCGDWGTGSFGFDSGDSIADWMVPLAGAIVKKILIRPTDFVGTVEFFLHSSNYDGEAASRECTDAKGWVGYWEEGTWTEGDNECFNAPPLGEQIWPDSITGGLLVEITELHRDEWVEVDLGVLGYPDVGSDPFFIDGHVVRNDGWGFGACNATILPYHGFKYYDSTGTSGNRGWHIRSFNWDLYALVEYYEPPMSSTIEKEGGLPTSFALQPAYPNPFNPTTTIKLSVPVGGLVTLRVYDLLGREVETILNQQMSPGNHKVQWNAGEIPSGIYIVRMRSGDPSTSSGHGFTQTRKVTVLR